jgi:hypothetical protein
MAKYANPSIMDAVLDKIAPGTPSIVCSQQSTTRTEAVATYALGSTTLASGDYT